MSQEYLGIGNDFVSALASYDESLAKENLGILTGVTFKNTSNTGSNIIITAIGVVVGAFTGHGFFSSTEADMGDAVLAEYGIHFFHTSIKRVKEDGVRKRKHVITGHSFVDYTDMTKSVVGRGINFAKQLNISGTVQDSGERGASYRLGVPLNSDSETMDTLERKLEAQGIRTRKSRTGKLVGVALLATIIALLVVAFQSEQEIQSRVANVDVVSQEVLGESDTYISGGGNFRLTFVDAFFETSGVGQRQTDIIVIFFDYEAQHTHRANRPFNRFTVYQGDVELVRPDSGIRMSIADGRGFVSVQDVEAGEVYRGMASVVPDNMTDPITLVVYGSGGNVLFRYELAVR